MRGSCPSQLRGCKYEGRCFTDDHHIYFPEADYKDKTERDFRELFVVNICRRMHDEIHAINLPPLKPSKKTMKETLRQHRRR